MSWLRSHAIPRLPDPAEEELRAVVQSHGCVLRLNSAARRNGTPHVELYRRGDHDALIARFTSCRSALRWLQSTPQPERHP